MFIMTIIRYKLFLRIGNVQTNFHVYVAICVMQVGEGKDQKRITAKKATARERKRKSKF